MTSTRASVYNETTNYIGKEARYYEEMVCDAAGAGNADDGLCAGLEMRLSYNDLSLQIDILSSQICICIFEVFNLCFNFCRTPSQLILRVLFAIFFFINKEENNYEEKRI